MELLGGGAGGGAGAGAGGGAGNMNRKQPAPRLNGLACPTCAEQLFDTHPNIILDSYPPQKNVNCKACGYVGTDWREPEKYDNRPHRHARYTS